MEKATILMVRYLLFLIFICASFSSGCQEHKIASEKITKKEITLKSSGTTIESRISLPPGYERMQHDKRSFATYLRTLKLKPVGSKVQFYDGREKPNDQIYEAVVDLDIGQKDLHQCADAVMRLRAEYLWNEERYDDIHFNFTNGFRVDYSEWMKGRRMVIKGNKTYWDNGSSTPNNSYENFWEYLELIFMYAGTSSLSKELKSVAYSEMEIGDVFIIGGFPGHAVIVVDMAINRISGQKIYLLAQSYMPAQEIQIFSNPRNSSLSPWYMLGNDEIIRTPEWEFGDKDLMRFVD